MLKIILMALLFIYGIKVIDLLWKYQHRGRGLELILHKIGYLIAVLLWPLLMGYAGLKEVVRRRGA